MCSYSSEWEWNTQGPSQTLREVICVYIPSCMSVRKVGMCFYTFV